MNRECTHDTEFVRVCERVDQWSLHAVRSRWSRGEGDGDTSSLDRLAHAPSSHLTRSKIYKHLNFDDGE